METDTFGVGKLCGYRRKKCKKDSRVYPKSIKRRFEIRSNDTQRIY